MLKKIISFIAIIIVISGVLWLGNENNKRSKEVSYTVSVEPVSLTKSVSTILNANGEVKMNGDKVESMVLEYDAILKELLVDDGQAVEVGQDLCKVQRYSKEQYEQNLRKLQEILIGYENDLKIINLVNDSEYDEKMKIVDKQITSEATNVKVLELELNNLETKSNQGEITLEEYEKQKYICERAILESNAKIQQLNESILTIKKSKIQSEDNKELINNNINEVQLQIEILNKNQDIIIKAEKSGVIAYNQELYSGMMIQQNQAFLKILDKSQVDSFYAQVKLLESEYYNLDKNSNIYINYGSGLNSKKYKGNLSDEIPKISYINDIAYYNIKVYFSEQVDLIIDAPVKVEIESNIDINNTAGNENSYFVLPINAVVSRNDKDAVLLYLKDTKNNSYYSKLVYVDIITSNNNTVIVSSPELDKESIIITDGNYDLYGGETVVLDGGEQSGYMDLNLFD